MEEHTTLSDSNPDGAGWALTGEMVPLSSLGTLRYMIGPNQITRFNKMSSAELNVQAATGVSSQRIFELVEGTNCRPAIESSGQD